MYKTRLITSAFAAILLSAQATATVLDRGAAQAQLPKPSQHKAKEFGGFFQPKGKGIPAYSKGASSRGGCIEGLSQDRPPLRLITPESNSGLTVSERPVFFAHVEASSAQQLIFSIRGENTEYSYRSKIATPANGGIVRLELPESAPILATGEQYIWSVILTCGPRLAPDSPSASALVQRVEPEQIFEVSRTPVAQASAYGQAGLWYDTVTVLADWQLESTSASEKAWKSLLTSQGLDTLVSVPIVSP